MMGNNCECTKLNASHGPNALHMLAHCIPIITLWGVTVHLNEAEEQKG